MSEPVQVLVFTDGAAKGNPGPGGWGAVVRVGRATVCELGGAGGHTTNNRMEMTGALEALRWLGRSAVAASVEVSVLTDSTYLIRGVTQWMPAWKKKGWKTASGSDVANRDLWEALGVALAEATAAGATMRWRYVRGHVGIAGNERADAIASGYASGARVSLYQGPYAGYGVDLDTVGSEASSAASSASPGAGKTTGKRPYSYLSVVDGVAVRHTNWPACERRVKGRSGARFKKAASAADEAAILAGWGFSIEDVSGSA